MLQDGQLGELISIEGRYWQASVAERAIANEGKTLLKSWKDDPRLSGDFDTYLDVGSHWIDAVSFLMGTSPSLITGWRSYLNSNAPHRDSHVHLALEFPGASRAFGSVSKTFHGAPNHFEINLIGSRRSATWEFLKPDEIQIGEGRDRGILTRKSCEQGSNQPPHHGMGWLEGYIEIASRLFQEIYQGRASNYPRLSDNLDLLQAMLGIAWRKFP